MADYFGRAAGDTYEQQVLNSVQASRFQNNIGAGTLTKIRVHYYAYVAGTIRLGVYADNAGVPGALLLDAGTVAMAANWVEITGLSLAVTNGTWYWIVVAESDWNGSRAVSAQGSMPDGSMLGYDAGSFTTLRTPFGSADYSQTKELVIQAYVEEGGGDAGVYAGDISVALTPGATYEPYSATMDKWCEGGRTSIGAVYLGVVARPTLWLGLYLDAAGGEPSVSAIVDDLTEPTATGYARIQLVYTDWTESPQSVWTNLQKTFAASGGDWGDVYGYFITTAETGIACDLVTVEQFADGPYDVYDGDQIKITPKLGFK